jgi:polar amino acid transport system substrate-binding protein
VKNTWRPIILIVTIVGAFVAGCGSALMAPSPETRQALAPSGKLRVGLSLGTPGIMIRDPASGETKGVGYELGKELARRLGVPFEPVIFGGNPQILEALKSGDVDIAFTGATPARAKEMDFSQPYLEIEDGFLVPAGSTISTMADVDHPGIRVGVTRGSTSDGKFSRELKNAVVVRSSTISDAIGMVASRQVDTFATNKSFLFEMSDKLPGSRVLDGRYGVEQVSIAIPKGRNPGMPFVREFVEEAKSNGLVRAAVQRAGLRGTVKESQ